MLERAREFVPAAALGDDPLGLVHEAHPSDRELVAHLAAPLAYGSVALIRRAIREVLAVLGPRPTDAVRAIRPGDFHAAAPAFVYRMTRAADVDAYLNALRVLLQRHGTLEAAFLAGYDPAHRDVVPALVRYVAELRAAAPADSRGLRYLTADPATGSATKRWHLMLRWLVRPDDGADLHLWTAIRPSQLVLPLDRHVASLVHSLGLSERRTVDYRMAREATDQLLTLDPADPLRFDMPLCHLGISRDCEHRPLEHTCGPCALRRACRWGRAVHSSSRPRSSSSSPDIGSFTDG